MKLPASLAAEYTRLGSDRSPYLERARDAAKYTIPTLLPPQGKTGATKLRRGYSNFGARCVNALASKLLLAVLPARQAFFKLVVEDAVLEALGGDEAATKVDQALGKIEAKVQQDIETTPTRTPLGEGIKHLLVGGNVLLQMLPKGGLKCYPLHAYVAKRDGEGSLLCAIAEDEVSPDTLPESVRGTVKAKIAADGSKSLTADVRLYTGIFRTGNHWRIWQEVEGTTIPESQGSYPLDESPWMALRWTPVDGESYGRGMVEDYLGYFQSLEALTGAVVKGAAISAKVVFLRQPNGQTKARDLARSETGDIIDGKEGDVTVLQAEKRDDMRTAKEMIAELKEELAYAFAMNQAIQRNAERVTAEEIRYMAQDLDSLLGGIYSTLSLEFQLPFLRRKMSEMRRANKLPDLPKEALRPVIVTGLDALGRGAELDNLRALVKDIVELGGIEQAQVYVNFGDLFTRLSTARSVKSAGLIKTEEQVAAAQAARQQQALIEQLGPNAINALGGMAKQGMANQSKPT